jgi:hypothetical protein
MTDGTEADFGQERAIPGPPECHTEVPTDAESSFPNVWNRVRKAAGIGTGVLLIRGPIRSHDRHLRRTSSAASRPDVRPRIRQPRKWLPDGPPRQHLHAFGRELLRVPSWTWPGSSPLWISR